MPATHFNSLWVTRVGALIGIWALLGAACHQEDVEAFDSVAQVNAGDGDDTGLPEIDGIEADVNLSGIGGIADYYELEFWLEIQEIGDPPGRVYLGAWYLLEQTDLPASYRYITSQNAVPSGQYDVRLILRMEQEVEPIEPVDPIYYSDSASGIALGPGTGWVKIGGFNLQKVR